MTQKQLFLLAVEAIKNGIEDCEHLSLDSGADRAEARRRITNELCVVVSEAAWRAIDRAIDDNNVAGVLDFGDLVRATESSFTFSERGSTTINKDGTP